jgi:hypothetical protein
VGVETAGVLVFTGSLVIFAVGFPVTMLVLPFLIPIGALAWGQLRAADRIRRGLRAESYGVLCGLAAALGAAVTAAQVGADDGPTSARAWLLVLATVVLTTPSVIALADGCRRMRLPSPTTVALASALALTLGTAVVLTMGSHG